VLAIENILLGLAILLFLSIIASKASGRLGIPALLLFLILGMLAGSEGPGGVYFDDPWLTQLIGVVALSFILFDGGLATEWRVVRHVFRRGFALSTLGVLISAISVGLFSSLVLGFSWIEGLLLGAIVSSTDAAAVFSILRSKDVRLKGDLEPLLELESGSNDPMAVFLTIGLTQILALNSTSIVTLVPMFFQQMILGTVLGLTLGAGASVFINRLKLGYEGLYPVLTVSLVLFTYGLTTYLGGNGFLAVFLAGVLLRHRDFVHRRSIMRFHDGLAWLMQIMMFLALGLLVFPSRLMPIIGVGLLISAFLIFIGRPLSVFLSLAFSKMNIREKTLVSWVGLRGAAPIILATFPLLERLPHSEMIFNLVFFIVLTSVILQGASIPFVARWLNLEAAALPPRPSYPLEFLPTASPNSELVELEIAASSGVIGKSILDLGLPNGALIVLVHRGEEFLVPSGSTILQAGDRMMVLADNESLADVHKILKKEKV
jgi:potassium/hydrogen antiporter